MDNTADLDKPTTFIARDPIASLMLTIALFLTLWDWFTAFLITRTHHPEAMEAPLVATAAFAATGVVVGLVRSLRGARAR